MCYAGDTTTNAIQFSYLQYLTNGRLNHEINHYTRTIYWSLRGKKNFLGDTKRNGEKKKQKGQGIRSEAWQIGIPIPRQRQI